VVLLVKRSGREDCKINIKRRQNTRRQHDGIQSNSVINQSINTISDARLGPGVCRTKKTETLFARVKRPLGLLMGNPNEKVDEFTPDAR